MALDPNHERHLSELQEHLDRARTVTSDLMEDVIVQACLRVRAHHPAAKARVARLIESGAFVEAALAMIELELPGWKLRRLVYEDGEWICSLSRNRELPDWLDDATEARHETLALAILAAFLEAQRDAAPSDQVNSTTVPSVRPPADYGVCCDNFA
jgi:hypothetical protein